MRFCDNFLEHIVLAASVGQMSGQLIEDIARSDMACTKSTYLQSLERIRLDDLSYHLLGRSLVLQDRVALGSYPAGVHYDLH